MKKTTNVGKILPSIMTTNVGSLHLKLKHAPWVDPQMPVSMLLSRTKSFPSSLNDRYPHALVVLPICCVTTDLYGSTDELDEADPCNGCNNAKSARVYAHACLPKSGRGH